MLTADAMLEMALSRRSILGLYRSLLRETNKWNSYNYRMYTLRKVRYEFEKNKSLTEEEQIDKCYKEGQEALELIKRQVIVGNMYSTKPLVVENTD